MVTDPKGRRTSDRSGNAGDQRKNDIPGFSRNRKGFNPIIYPDLYFQYTVRVRPEGQSFRIIVDLDKPLPLEWIGKVGFNLEFFPGDLFGKTWYMDDQEGIFPRQADGPMIEDGQGIEQIKPIAIGKKLVIAPESDSQRITIENELGDLKLIDGRGKHNNGWFIVRSLVAEGAAKGAIEWYVAPYAIPDFEYKPVVQTSQVGYHPNQQKIAVIELDQKTTKYQPVILYRINEEGGLEEVKRTEPKSWGKFLRYQYMQFDFTEVEKPGMYMVKYGDAESAPFQISKDIYQRYVWQPTLEYFLPVQMCHMRVNDRYRVWHGLCHMDDALMAPVDTNHFDGYKQGPSTLTKYKSLEPVPGLNQGGWHDAGDYDLRVESQAGTVYILSLTYEAFHINYDNTTIDEQNHVVELLTPDGKPDIIQQIEHGVLTVANGYESLGRLYRGIICPTLRQYTLLGDPVNMTDNLVYDARLKENQHTSDRSGKMDDRWVFTEENPYRELQVAASLAAASRVLKDFNAPMSTECLGIAKKLYASNVNSPAMIKVKAATELYLTTGDQQYLQVISNNVDDISKNIKRAGWIIGRLMPSISDENVKSKILDAIRQYRIEIDEQEKETPYGVPYKPNIWGAGWGIQEFGFEQYFLSTGYPDIFSDQYMLQALNFVLGCHPGENNASFASGVGAKSLTVAYGFNRADWSYIPGGVGSGTALIRPDLPELKKWPYFWQQTEYVMGGGGTNFMFLVLAADQLLSK